MNDLLQDAGVSSPDLRCGLLLLLMVVGMEFVVLAVSVSVHAQSKPAEYEVKAAYLYNFGRFVGWPAKQPATGGDSFVICVIGQDPFGPVLDATLVGGTIEGKSVIAKRVSKSQDAAACRILFISSSEDGRLKEILSAVGDTGVLTVSDIPQFSRRGGMIQFIQDGDRVRFEVNVASAERAGLTLSSELLKVASAVRRNFHPGA